MRNFKLKNKYALKLYFAFKLSDFYSHVWKYAWKYAHKCKLIKCD